MYRYKINELTLCSLLEYIKDDEFIQGYEQYLKTQNSESFIISDAIKHLEPHPKFKEEIKLTLYIVYSFVLKFDSIDEENKNLYDYTISKDQFRVHYHINKLDYTNKADFELKQANLAKLIDVYFLKRIKRFKEVELKG